MRYNYQLICEECSLNVSKISPSCAYLLMEACSCHADRELMVLRDKQGDLFCDLLMALEITGYLVSFDVGSDILYVKLNTNRLEIKKDGRYCSCN